MLCSLSPSFEHKVVTIEKTRDLEVMTFEIEEEVNDQ